MTKSVEAARAYVQAHDALASPEHTDDVAKLRELSKRVKEREAKFDAAQEALFGAHRDEVETGEAEPADNEEAAQVINGYGHTYDSDVFEDFTPPARAD